MATLTLTTIRSLVRSDLNETTTTRLLDSELNSIANDGYKDTAVKGLCYESKISKENIPASVRMVPLVTNSVIRVNYVEYDLGATGSRGLLTVLPQTVGFNPISGSTSGTPGSWFQWGPYLIIEPFPDAATYDLNVFASCYPAAVMSADGDTPASLPVEFHECVYLFTLAFACLKLKRWADAAAAYNRYIASVQVKRAEYVLKQRDARALHTIPDAVEVGNGRG